MEMKPVKVRERGPTPRKFRKSMTAAKRHGWKESAQYFHTDLREKRFTRQHARTAGYGRRSRRYVEQKKRRFGHMRPLEYTGDLRRRLRLGRIEGTTKLGRAKYPGGNKLNFRQRNSALNLRVEFTTLTRRETTRVARVFDGEVDRQLKLDKTQETRVVR